MITEPRNSIYAVYKGKEYKAADDSLIRKIILFTRDSLELQNGFVEFAKQHYEKAVAVSDLDFAYDVVTYAQYGGYKFQMCEVEDGKALLFTSKITSEMKHLGFGRIEPHVYEKWVPLEELESVFEEKTPVWGFTLPNE